MRVRFRDQRFGMDWLTSAAAVPGLLLVVAVTELVVNTSIEHRVAAAVGTPLMIAALLWRRQFGVRVAWFVGAAFFVQTVAGVAVNALLATSLALGVSAFAIGRHSPRIGGLWGMGGLIVLVLASSVASDAPPGDVAVATMIFVLAWLAGTTLAHRARETTDLTERAALVEANAREWAAAAVELERRRIARELHDTIAHAITVMVLQAGAAEAVLPAGGDPRARDALRTVQESGRGALVDMSHLLGVLRSAGDNNSLMPMPSLGDLDALVAQLAATGLPISLSTEGDLTSCPPSVASSAYHIVREALTNSLRHAGPAHAEVKVCCTSRIVDLEVLDDGRGSHDAMPGYGLLGMRERVAAFGGDFECGARPGGGYRVHACFPLSTGSLT